MKMYGKIFALSAEVSLFLKKYCTDFQKNDTNGKIGCSSMFQNFLVVSFHFTPRSTASESFSRGIFDLIVFNFFFFSNMKSTHLS